MAVVKSYCSWLTYSENEKYLFIAFLRALGIEFNVSGCGFDMTGKEGYLIGFNVFPSEKIEIDNFLSLWEKCEKERV